MNTNTNTSRTQVEVIELCIYQGQWKTIAGSKWPRSSQGTSNTLARALEAPNVTGVTQMLFTLCTIALYTAAKVIIKAQDAHYHSTRGSRATPQDLLDENERELDQMIADLAQLAHEDLDAPIELPNPVKLQGWAMVEPTDHSIRELKAIAKHAGIKNYGRFNKVELYNAIAAA